MKLNDIRNAALSHLIQQPHIILIIQSQIQCTGTKTSYMSKPNQCLQENLNMVAKLLNGPRTTSSRRTLPQMYSTDKWAGGIWTTPSGDVQKTWRWQDLPTRSTRREQVNLITFFLSHMLVLVILRRINSLWKMSSPFSILTPSFRRHFTDAVIPGSLFSKSLFSGSSFINKF